MKLLVLNISSYTKFLILVYEIVNVFGGLPQKHEQDRYLNLGGDTVRVNKCCEGYELYVGKSCVHVNSTNETLWQPLFTTTKGKTNVKVSYSLITGTPDCGSRQVWPILFNGNSTDKLWLLPTGVLRHVYEHPIPNEYDDLGVEIIGNDHFYDFPPGQYCMDKRVDGKFVSEFAKVCVPEQENSWTRTEFVMHNIVNPVTHGI